MTVLRWPLARRTAVDTPPSYQRGRSRKSDRWAMRQSFRTGTVSGWRNAARGECVPLRRNVLKPNMLEKEHNHGRLGSFF